VSTLSGSLQPVTTGFIAVKREDFADTPSPCSRSYVVTEYKDKERSEMFPTESLPELLLDWVTISIAEQWTFKLGRDFSVSFLRLRVNTHQNFPSSEFAAPHLHLIHTHSTHSQAGNACKLVAAFK
jgi:hypothetical protein